MHSHFLNFMSSRRKKIKKKISRLGLFFALILVIAILIGGRFYKYIYGDNVKLKGEYEYLYIRKGESFKEVCANLDSLGFLRNLEGFVWVAQKKSYPNLIKSGKFKLTNGMNNNQLVNMLRLGIQEPVNVTFNNIRTLEDLGGNVGKQLMLDSLELLQLLNDEAFVKELGFNKYTIPALFIPNTYEMYWNTGAKAFIVRMQKEYNKFWNQERRNQAKAQKLSPVEVATLASIVDEETAKSDEKPMVAGLYLNRLNRGMLLQADPTLKFALGDFSIKRLLNKDKKVNSLYNTYMYAGLPPGPIRMPSIGGMNAVLNPAQHKYLYMCAKEDFSGYHNFAKTLSQHNVNAQKYQRELRRLGIRR